MTTGKIQTGLRIEEITYGKAKIISAAEHRSLNNLIEHALMQYIAKYELEHGTITVNPEDIYR